MARSTGTVLKALRQFLQLDQRAFAKILGVSNPLVCLMEQGKATVTPKTSLALCDELGMSPDFWVALNTPQRRWPACLSKRSRKIAARIDAHLKEEAAIRKLLRPKEKA